MISDSGKVMNGVISNVSASGASITFDAFIPLGKKLSLSFKLREGANIKDITASVIRVQDLQDSFQIALEFINITGEARESIENVINDIYFLKGVKLFANISHDEAISLKGMGKDVKYKAEDVIFTEDSEGDSFYAVISGKVRITKKSNIDDKNDEVLALIRESEFFGEMALFNEGKRSANAIAHSDCVLFVLTVDDFNRLDNENHKLAVRILVEFIKTLARRLRNMNQEMVDLLFSETPIRDVNEGKKP